MKTLIVAADDFGLTKSVNEGIIRAVREGIVTAVNMIPSADAFDDAVRLAAEAGIGEAGAHLALTETSPTADPSKIRTLLAGDGNFLGGRMRFVPRYLSGRVDADEMYIELKNQLDMIAKNGIRIACLSSHEHLHMMPGILDIFIKLAKEYDVPAIRVPGEKMAGRPLRAGDLLRSAVMSCLVNNNAGKIRASGLATAGHFFGFFDSGRLDEEALLAILDRIGDGVTELVCHPGFIGPEMLAKYTFHRNCEAELSALTSPLVRKVIKERGIHLAGYGECIPGK